jgi:hypothetical protein
MECRIRNKEEIESGKGFRAESAFREEEIVGKHFFVDFTDEVL